MYNWFPPFHLCLTPSGFYLDFKYIQKGKRPIHKLHLLSKELKSYEQ